MATKRLTPEEIDETSRKIEELDLVPMGTKLSPDGSFGPNMHRTFGSLASIADEGEGNPDYSKLQKLVEWMNVKLHCSTSRPFAALYEFRSRLPTAHEFTPVERVNAVLRVIQNVLRSQPEGKGRYIDKQLVLDGMIPPTNGRIPRLVDFWNGACKSAFINPSEIIEVQEMIRFAGFAPEHFLADGDWAELSALALNCVLSQGRRNYDLAHLAS